ncbi:hypothetical protein [Actinoallomurus acaciae]|uniref:Uncharacterized protein n=1 Tax=Actinoallomurus acaciae TaxID=502577 RepID=A0ABV5YIT6_9ACTN
MSYPGDQQQPGGWGHSQPPSSSPYGPGDDQAGHGGPPSFGSPHDDPYGTPPRDGGYGPGGGAGGYGGSFGDDPQPYGNAFERDPSYGSHDEGADPYGGGPGGYGPGDDFDSGSGSGRKRLIIGAAIAVGVIVVVGGAAFALTSGGDDKPKTEAAPSSAPPVTPTPTPTPSPTETGRGDRLMSRTTDPKLLTLNEIFKARSFKAGGRRYLMTARRAERKCSPPTHGTTFRKALARGACDQVLRATFSNGKLIGTIGVINLRTQTAATSAQSAARQKDAFILALPGAGTTKKIGQGLSLTTTEVNGHYLIMSWVQYPNGKKIAKSDYSAVTSFVKYTTYGSNLRTALNYRSMEGKPA